MISKEKFIQYMETLEKLCKAEEKINEILSEFGTENQIWFDKHESLIVDILQEVFNDKENDWIGYVIYELDWFKGYSDGMIKDKYGNNIPLTNAGDLYNLLMKNIENSTV